MKLCAFSRLLISMAALPLIACERQPPADLASIVVIDARVWTGDSDNPWADAVAVDGDVIIAVGSEDDVSGFIGIDTRVLSVQGSMLVPGFIDTLFYTFLNCCFKTVKSTPLKVLIKLF